MKASQEPKELQIENLKSQLLNLEEVFEQQMKEIKKESESLSKNASKMKQKEKDLGR